MAEFDRDHLRIGVGDAWKDDLQLEAWDWLVDPMAPRRIRMTSVQCDQFARAIERGEPVDITGEDGLAAIEMVEAAILSSKTNSAVRIPIEQGVRDEVHAREAEAAAAGR
jgi:predicted dehydrogenase